MSGEQVLAETAPEKVFLRLTAVACLAVSCVLLVGEFWSGSLGLRPGALLAGGLGLCLLANLLSLVLLILRRRRAQ